MEILENQDSWKDVLNILKIHGKVPKQSRKYPITQTPQQFKNTYKRKHRESSLKGSKTSEEKSSKKKKLEEIEEEETKLPQEIIPKKKGLVVTVEVMTT